MPASNYLRTKVVDAALRGQTFPVIATVYVGLFTADPTANFITGNEVQPAAFTAYARQVMTFSAQGTPGVTANAATVTFPPVAGAGFTATHFATFDLATAGGNMISYGPLTASKTYASGDVPSFISGQLTTTFG